MSLPLRNVVTQYGSVVARAESRAEVAVLVVIYLGIVSWYQWLASHVGKIALLQQHRYVTASNASIRVKKSQLS